MRVDRMIEMLSKLDPAAIVKAFDADTEDFAPVSGCVYDFGEVEIQTDTDDSGKCDHPACWGPCVKCGVHVHESEHGRFCPNCGRV